MEIEDTTIDWAVEGARLETRGKAAYAAQQ